MTEGLGLVWTVGRHRFRSWMPAEEEQYAFLLMWAPLKYREREALEMFDGLDGLCGKMPATEREVAERTGIPEDEVRSVVATARRKVATHLKFNGLPIRTAKQGRTAAAALDRLRAATHALRETYR